MKVEERIKGFVYQEKDNSQRTIEKRKRVKEKKNKGFRTRKELAQIENELCKQARSNEQKAAMRKLLGAVVQQVILPTVCEGNQFDPKYVEYKSLAMEIINSKLKDL